MNIQGLDYNTQRETLQLPEYGREIQKMVDYAVTIESRDERLRCAQTIVKLMETKVPRIHENGNFQQTLWDHLYLMSHGQLDIDWPFDVSGAESIHAKPQPVGLPQSDIQLRHYGKLVEQLIEKLKSMPEGPERDQLVTLTANQMKRDLMQWGHGSMDDERVANDLYRLTDGIIQLNLDQVKLNSILPADDQKRSGKKKK